MVVHAAKISEGHSYLSTQTDHVFQIPGCTACINCTAATSKPFRDISTEKEDDRNELRPSCSSAKKAILQVIRIHIKQCLMIAPAADQHLRCLKNTCEFEPSTGGIVCVCHATQWCSLPGVKSVNDACSQRREGALSPSRFDPWASARVWQGEEDKARTSNPIRWKLI